MPAKELPGQQRFDFNRAAQLSILERAVITTRGPGKAVLKALDSYQRSDDTSFPRVRTLAQNIGCSADTVRRTLHELRELGFIHIRERKRPNGSYASNEYEIVWSHILNAAESPSPEGGYSHDARGVLAPCKGGTRTVQVPLSVHHKRPLKRNDMGAMDGNLISEKGGRRDWWGRQRPLTKQDLLEPKSILGLFAYAQSKGWATSVDQVRFFALCGYCAREGRRPGALLTDSVTKRKWMATLADEDLADRQVNTLNSPPPSPEFVNAIAAAVAGIGVPANARRDADEQIAALAKARRERAAGER